MEALAVVDLGPRITPVAIRHARLGLEWRVHGTENNHPCLLERKHQVEDAIYAIGGAATAAETQTPGI